MIRTKYANDKKPLSILILQGHSLKQSYGIEVWGTIGAFNPHFTRTLSETDVSTSKA